ncbi:C-type lectin domain-containing protein [Pedosphaera parvula]|uniref:C-type lectin domain protein n=1 Tax=Pedosphaera parvula (strain Ellin514) TaxID=320771 RepID=B9XMJ5_PEDPL|nr:C-type lectin domain-containing protein [Pedosphaera parvula]EEF58894.1 C-type lectin domain protein [Pedosphaera parvula Ellin514]
MNFLFRTQNWFAIFAVLMGTGQAFAQTWVQWSAAAGGNNHYYALTTSATNWTTAEHLAISWGGTLATITTSNEQNFINARFLTGAYEHRPLWIGLIDRHANSRLRQLKKKFGLTTHTTFNWVTGEPLTYSNWKPGQPDDFGEDEFCGTINWHYSDNPPRGTKGDWNDAPLNGTIGFGGTTDGPYFGLVERDTDPSRPVKSSNKYTLATILITVFVILLCIWVTRLKRPKNPTG